MTKDEALRILGIKITGPTEKDIKSAYRFKAFMLAPDRLPPNASQDMIARATEELKEVNAAYTYLMNNKNDLTQAPRAGEQTQNVYREKRTYPAPKLIITPNHIRFKELEQLEVKSTHIEIKNIGGPFTNFYISTKDLPKWLEITEIKKLSTQALPVRINIKVTGQQLGNKYECYIPIRIENKESRYNDEANIHVEMVMRGPILQIDKKLIEFNIIPGIIPPPQSITLINSGVGYIEGNLIPIEQWIKISPRSIMFSNKQNIQIQIDASKLINDTSSYIDIKTNGGNEIIIVKATLHYEKTKAKQQLNEKDILAPFTLYYCPKCGPRCKQNTIWYNRHQNKYECLKCKRHWKTQEAIK